ncbi:hypothetical protein Rsub_09930 [Raphidocelis subcapitata]|uniref:Nudix hydrolase domain-containing protein n=1 Tax=Raphidocelis subcapitata TaxID=307507 RepID=A0A2V0PCI3_9CHLO|nr:hypothetical protein Rsub_09930 [Raphidocelis subcapitata]|eukprot:GBF97239.1 hypothetical protein Rsub_09930 [Raphidocelis subcapitata]
MLTGGDRRAAVAWTRPVLSLRGVAGLLAALLALAWLLRAPLCASPAAGAAPLTEEEMHARGVWRAPRLGADSFVARRRRSTGAYEVALVQRGKEPFLGAWALPGGFVYWMEDPIAAVQREIKEETNLDVDMQTPPVFVSFRGSPTRDPRAHSLSAGYVTKVTAASVPDMRAGDDAGNATWFSLADAVNGKVAMAFDHRGILKELAAWFEAHGKAKGLYADTD